MEDHIEHLSFNNQRHQAPSIFTNDPAHSQFASFFGTPLHEQSHTLHNEHIPNDHALPPRYNTAIASGFSADHCSYTHHPMNSNLPSSESLSGVLSERVYQCTFPECTSSFQYKALWKNHEESKKHWLQQKFMCLLCISQDPNVVTCRYCYGEVAPQSNIYIHSLSCDAAMQEGRSFCRKDQLKAHLKSSHSWQRLSSNIETWAFAFQSDWPRQCGFCGDMIFDWSQRIDHVEKHFKEGRRISDWRLPFLGNTQSVTIEGMGTFNDDGFDDGSHQDRGNNFYGLGAWPSTWINAPAVPQNGCTNSHFDSNGHSALRGFLETPVKCYDRIAQFTGNRLLNELIYRLLIEIRSLYSQDIVHGNPNKWNIMVNSLHAKLLRYLNQDHSISIQKQEFSAANIYHLGQVIFQLSIEMKGIRLSQIARHDNTKLNLNDEHSIPAISTQSSDEMLLSKAYEWDLDGPDISILEQISSKIPEIIPTAQSVCNDIVPAGCCTKHLLVTGKCMEADSEASGTMAVSLDELWGSFSKASTSDSRRLSYDINKMTSAIDEENMTATFRAMLRKVPRRSSLEEYILEPPERHHWFIVDQLVKASLDLKHQKIVFEASNRSYDESVSASETYSSVTSSFSKNESIFSDTSISSGVKSSVEDLVPKMNELSRNTSVVFAEEDKISQSASIRYLQLPCPFSPSGCQPTFKWNAEEDWINHTISHFEAYGIIPPIITSCVFPSCHYEIPAPQHMPPDKASAQLYHWRSRMLHVASHYTRNSDRVPVLNDKELHIYLVHCSIGSHLEHNGPCDTSRFLLIEEDD